VTSRQRLAAIAAVVVAVAAGTLLTRNQSPSTSTATANAPVVVILMENKAYTSVVGSSLTPYINHTLIATGRTFTNYHSITKPSLPNYLAITSGGTNGCTSDTCATTITVNNIFNELRTSGASAKSYQESMPTNCSTLIHTSNDLYWRKHNPEVFYTDTHTACQADNVPLGSSFGTLADFNFVTPNICDDMHGNTNAGCPSGTNANISKGDTWLSTHVPQLVAAGAKVIVVWDEGTVGSDQVLCVEVGAGVTASKDGTRYDHFSLLAGLEGYFGVPKLQKASTATPLPI
jgi:acid phosphatase